MTVRRLRVDLQVDLKDRWSRLRMVLLDDLGWLDYIDCGQLTHELGTYLLWTIDYGLWTVDQLTIVKDLTSYGLWTDQLSTSIAINN